MRVRIEHETHYAYDETVRYWIQSLRMTPRSHDGQHVRRWRIEPSVDGRLMQREDSLGNIVYQFSADAPADELIIRVTGEVETHDAHGFVRGAVERAPDLYYLRETEQSVADEAMRAFAEEAAKPARGDRIALLHRLMAAIHERVALAPHEHSALSASEAFEKGHGIGQDIAHVFIGCARHLGVPARYVSGYFFREDDAGRNSAHAWAEAKVEDVGWIGFDPANDTCVDEAHVRVAIGLDHLGAAPVRGSRTGGGQERMSVRIAVEDATPRARSGTEQSQAQSQS